MFGHDGLSIDLRDFAPFSAHKHDRRPTKGSTKRVDGQTNGSGGGGPLYSQLRTTEFMGADAMGEPQEGARDIVDSLDPETDRLSSDTVFSVPKPIFHVVFASIKHVLSWVLFISYSSTPDTFESDPASGTTTTLIFFVSLWYFAPVAGKFVYEVEPAGLGTEFKKLLSNSRTGWVHFVFAAFLYIYFGEDTFPPSERRTVFRGCVGVLLITCAVESASMLRSAFGANAPNHTYWYVPLTSAVCKLVSCICLYHFDRLPRNRLDIEPNLWLVILACVPFAPVAILAHGAQYVARIVRILRKVGETTQKVTRISRQVWRCCAYLVAVSMLFSWVAAYLGDYDAVRDACSPRALPALLRYGAAAHSPSQENLLACHARCDSVVEPTLPCPSEHYEGCCDSITAIFTLGELNTTRRGIMVLLCIVSTVGSFVDLVTYGIELDLYRSRNARQL